MNTLKPITAERLLLGICTNLGIPGQASLHVTEMELSNTFIPGCISASKQTIKQNKTARSYTYWTLIDLEHFGRQLGKNRNLHRKIEYHKKFYFGLYLGMFGQTSKRATKNGTLKYFHSWMYICIKKNNKQKRSILIHIGISLTWRILDDNLRK